MSLPSVSSIPGVVFYGVVASLTATFIIFLVKRLICSSPTKVFKQKIKGTGIISITDSPNARVNGGVKINEKKESK